MTNRKSPLALAPAVNCVWLIRIAMTLVMAPPAKKVTFRSAQIVQQDSTVTVPTEVQAKYKTVLAQKLFDTSNGGFTDGQGLVVKYRFIQYTRAARFNRWFFGGIGDSGEASTALKVDPVFPALSDARRHCAFRRAGSGRGSGGLRQGTHSRPVATRQAPGGQLETMASSNRIL